MKYATTERIKMVTKKQLKYRVDHDAQASKPFHFFASSVGEWRACKNLDDLIAGMRRSKMPFNVFYVPLPETAGYQINFYAPQVEGSVYLGHYGFEDLPA